jgi:hypothetical protein
MKFARANVLFAGAHAKGFNDMRFPPYLPALDDRTAFGRRRHGLTLAQ